MKPEPGSEYDAVIMALLFVKQRGLGERKPHLFHAGGSWWIRWNGTVHRVVGNPVIGRPSSITYQPENPYSS